MNPEEILAVHQVYCKITGFTPNLRVNERVYAAYLEAGFTAENLGCVLRYLVSENRRMSGAKFSLRLDKLLDFEFIHFDGLLQEASARERNRPKSRTEKEKIVSLFRNTETPGEDKGAQNVAEVLRRMAGEKI